MLTQAVTQREERLIAECLKDNEQRKAKAFQAKKKLTPAQQFALTQEIIHPQETMGSVVACQKDRWTTYNTSNAQR